MRFLADSSMFLLFQIIISKVVGFYLKVRHKKHTQKKTFFIGIFLSFQIFYGLIKIFSCWISVTFLTVKF